MKCQSKLYFFMPRTLCAGLKFLLAIALLTILSTVVVYNVKTIAQRDSRMNTWDDFNTARLLHRHAREHNNTVIYDDKDDTKTRATSSKGLSKYLIYLCDGKDYCFGLGDRQRAIASMYLLALVTNRTFGVNMSSPSPFTDMYIPNKVQWNILDSEIQGKSTREYTLFRQQDFPVPSYQIDFNKVFPEDVVYLRTNRNFINMLLNNPLYSTHLPKLSKWDLYPYVWTKLMTPSDYLREALNSELSQVVQEMSYEFSAFSKFDFSKCDNNVCSHGTLQFKSADGKDYSICKVREAAKQLVLENNTPNYCVVTPPRIYPVLSVEDVKSLRGYEVANLDLVCVHLRLGKSSTFGWEKSRNKFEDLYVVWNFLQPYVDGGHHVYVASDSQEVRELALARFGYRVHVSQEPIVHIARVQEGQDKKKGFRLAAMEQLLLSTSCKVLVISNSNLSIKAAAVRYYINTHQNTHMFKNGRIRRINPSNLF